MDCESGRRCPDFLGFHEYKDWREQAEELFFKEHMRIATIASVVARSRVAVSRHLTARDDYAAEMEWRRGKSAESRREYKRRWMEDYRSGLALGADGDSLRAEHDKASVILSRERFFDE